MSCGPITYATWLVHSSFSDLAFSAGSSYETRRALFIMKRFNVFLTKSR